MAKFRLFRDYEEGYWIEHTSEQPELRRHVVIDLDEDLGQDILNNRAKYLEYQDELYRKWRSA